ncbi:MAG: hypothetical protein VCB60_11935, partial [Alphaproteobacteria bacterium]
MGAKKYPKYLYQRPEDDPNGIFWFRRRLSGTTDIYRQSLHTRDLKQAVAARDKLLKGWEDIDRKVSGAENLLALRKKYLSATQPEDRQQLEQMISDNTGEMAQKLGVLEKLKFKEHLLKTNAIDFSQAGGMPLSQDERKPIEYYGVATGSLTVFKELVPHWLESVENKKTRSDYRRAFDLLMKEYVAAEELDWEKCKVFLRDRIRLDGKSRATVQKWRGAYVKFWDYLDLDTHLWKEHKLPETEEIEILPFTRAEVRALYDKAKQEQSEWGPWLYHVIWIAAHTGARAGAIVGLQYNREEQTIWL